MTRKRVIQDEAEATVRDDHRRANLAKADDPVRGVVTSPIERANLHDPVTDKAKADAAEPQGSRGASGGASSLPGPVFESVGPDQVVMHVDTADAPPDRGWWEKLKDLVAAGFRSQ